ncbi:MAG: hypothetical protein AAGJ35_02815, partial [Myxococcota bacterium]
PSFDRFQGWKKLDNFTRQDHRNGKTSFLYRVRFRPVQTGNMTLAPTRLRFPRPVLEQLQRKHQICLFQGGRAEHRLISAIAKDHMGIRAQDGCTTGTQELETPALHIQVSPLPQEAANVQLIGMFRLQSQLQKLRYPHKKAHVAEQPFYWIVTISGQGDLQRAKQQVQIQLEAWQAKLSSQNVSTEIETQSLPSQQLRLQVQVLAEQPQILKLPSLKLKFYARDEGVITAQSLPLSVRIQPNKSKNTTRNNIPTAPKPPQTRSETLRSNQILIGQTLPNQYFSFTQWSSLGFLFLSPFLLFVFLLGFVFQPAKASAEKKKYKRARQNAITTLQQLNQPIQDPQKALLALQQYAHERLQTPQKTPTSDELREHLAQTTPKLLEQAIIQQWIQQWQSLENAVYGGGSIADLKSTSLVEKLQQLDRLLYT